MKAPKGRGLPFLLNFLPKNTTLSLPMKDTSQEFAGFEYPVTELAKYIRAGDIFTILLKNGSIIHHTIKEQELFEKWLLNNKIENIKQKDVKEPGKKSSQEI